MEKYFCRAAFSWHEVGNLVAYNLVAFEMAEKAGKCLFVAIFKSNTHEFFGLGLST